MKVKQKLHILEKKFSFIINLLEAYPQVRQNVKFGTLSEEIYQIWLGVRNETTSTASKK